MTCCSRRRRRTPYETTIVFLVAVICCGSMQSVRGNAIKHPRQTDLVIDIRQQQQEGDQLGQLAASNRNSILACSPCADQQSMKLKDESESDDGGECSILEAKTVLIPASSTEECQLQQLANYQKDCCTQPPQGVCSLCPNGEPFDALTIVPSLHAGIEDSRTCSDLMVGELDAEGGTESERHFPFLDYLFVAGDCSDTLLQRSSAWCQCPGVVPECSLCRTGQRPSLTVDGNARREKVFYGWDCDAFELVASWFSRSECSKMVTDILEFDAPAFCECEGGGPPPDLCSLCGDDSDFGQTLNPDELLEDGAYTCEDLATSLRFIPSESTCNKLLDSFHDGDVYSTCCLAKTHIVGTVNEGGTSTEMKPKAFFVNNAWTIASFSVASALLIGATWLAYRQRRFQSDSKHYIDEYEL